MVTLLVAAQGKLQLPRITSREELVTALNRLGAVREDQVHSCACLLRRLVAVRNLPVCYIMADMFAVHAADGHGGAMDASG